MATTLPDMNAVGTDIKNKLALKAPLASPTFTGTPKAPTASTGTNTTQVATTAFVKAQITSDINTKANLATPTFTGTPKAPTAAAGTNTTQIATTAFVTTAVSNFETTLTTALSELITEYGGTVPS